MIILVCGGRHYSASRQEFFKAMAPYAMAERIIHGGAKGADTLAGRWAEMTETPCTVYRAEWSKWGGIAGNMRNERMIIEGKPDIVIAFPGGRGTRDMVTRAKAHNIEVIEI